MSKYSKLMALSALIVLTVPSSLVYAEFSRVLKFDIMEKCVGNHRSSYRAKKIMICGCALDKTESKLVFFEHDDEDYRDEKAEFIKEFKEHVKYYTENYKEKCKP